MSLSEVVAAITVSPLYDMVASQAAPLRHGQSFGRTRIDIVWWGEAGGRVQWRWGRDQVQYVGIAPLSVSSVFVSGIATELLGTLVKTLTGSFQSLVVS